MQKRTFLAVCVAWGLDLLGEPPASCHPVVWYGKLIGCLERCAPQGHLPQFCYGIAMFVFSVPIALLPSLLVGLLARRTRLTCIRLKQHFCGDLLYALIVGTALKPFFALRMLADAGRAVRLSLESEKLLEARQALQSLVSRDRSQLTAELTAAAAIESLAENLSDSVVAPLLYYAVFGLPGAVLYRLCNTFDSMIGYHGRYEYLGKAAARIDDLLNLLPARLTALLIIVCAPFFGGECRQAWHIWRRDAHKTASPNAGHPMAAAAGVLNIQLEKVGHYALGDPHHTISTQDIKRAERMVWLVGGIALVLTAMSKIAWSTYHE